ncbi:MAG TPA: ATP-binding protein [Clostridiales bacterium]|nr:ATP-binding protein [Clostridiales bacterium]
MSFKSIQWRLVSIFILITIFLITPVGLFLNRKVETQHYDSFKSSLERGFDNWLIKSDSSLKDMLSYLSVNDGRNAIIEFSILDAYKSYTVIDKNDLSVKYSSDRYYSAADSNGKLFMNEIICSVNFIAVLNNELKGDKSKLVNINGRRYFDYAREVKLADGDFILYFRYDSEAWQETITGFNKIILISLLISVLISLILGYMLSKTITSPINKIMYKAQRLAAGDFDQMLEVMSDDEIGQLTKAFNYMAKNLKDTLTEISSEKNKIETIFNYMTDGVIAFNLKGEAIHVNPAFLKMLGQKEFNYTFNEFVEEYGLDLKLEEILYLETFSSRESSITKDGKILKAYFAMFTDEFKKAEGIIAVLHDITEQEKLENMRKEFVANVSHELRTPLTSIKSYTESLLDGDIDDREIAESFLNVINSEADRMTRLVKDLLQLSRLDNKQMQWNMKEISFVELIRNSANKLQIEAKNKGHKLECYVIGDIPLVKGDRDRLEQVTINIITNAIKYTPEGGKVSVYIGKTYNEAYVKVADNGVGIPEEDLPRIFERFYRVDKARSREMGGTGLGLSIAREIIEAHGGTINITSELGKGTEVLVRLPAVSQDIACNSFLNTM